MLSHVFVTVSHTTIHKLSMPLLPFAVNVIHPVTESIVALPLLIVLAVVPSQNVHVPVLILNIVSKQVVIVQVSHGLIVSFVLHNFTGKIVVVILSQPNADAVVSL